MTDVLHPDSRQAGQDAGGSGPASLPALHVRAFATPVAGAAIVGAAAVAFTLATDMPTAAVRTAAIAAATAIVIVLLAALYSASATTRDVRRRVAALQSDAGLGQQHLREMVRDIQGGQQPRALTPAPAHVAYRDPFRKLGHDVDQLQYIAEQAVIRASTLMPVGSDDQRVEIFVNLARRMQSLVHRQIQLLDTLEFKVEDPDLLKELFRVDHLATLTLRAAENVGVVGGAPARRQWTRQVTMHEALRAAISEVEQYSRVKVVPPAEGHLKGVAVSDVIHLIAELIENATRFSSPQQPVLLRAQRVTAGLAVEVEDRGLGMTADNRQRMNVVLADPGRINITELLRDGRIGLFVVSTLARRHGINVQLQNNIYGGIQAVAVLPSPLLATDEESPPGPDGIQELEVTSPSAAALTSAEPAEAEPDPRPPADSPVLVSGGAAGMASAAPAGQPPPLPQRRPQTHMATELRDAPARLPNAAAGEPTADLMARFQEGFRPPGEDEDEATAASDGTAH